MKGGAVMALFGKDKAQEVIIAGHKLICPVCGGAGFFYRQTLLNTAGMTFMKLDWANTAADNYYCAECGYMFWFHPKQ
jgi:predicted RNA-binding Zn-ribbon protein involved in translation (DUF1610 family)